MQPHTIWALAAIAGTWQGIVSVGNATFRDVFKFTSSAAGWKTETYEGALAQDGQSFTGTWIEFDGRYPLTLRRVRGTEAWPATPSPHTARFIQVDTAVKLEVLDWGGSGRPLVFLSGLGGSAHDFDTFAPDAAMWYAYYDGSVGELAFDRADLIRQLQQLRPERMTPSELRALIRSHEVRPSDRLRAWRSHGARSAHSQLDPLRLSVE